MPLIRATAGHDEDVRMPRSNRITRRTCVESLLAAGALAPAMLSLTGCDQLAGVLGGSCPDPVESGGIDWTPDVLHPVFAGYRELSATQGAPGLLRVFYPTFDGFAPNARILKLCLVRWPVVLFLHGKPPDGCAGVDYFNRWQLLPAALARSGYVVIVPSYSPQFTVEENPATVNYMLSLIDWIRSDWEHARWVDAHGDATAVCGHSRGALLAAHVLHARPDIAAYVGLCGTWAEYSEPAQILARLMRAPSFFVWGSGGQYDVLTPALWAGAPFGRTAAIFAGQHFDPLDPWSGCAVPRGRCSLIPQVTADLAALFISRHVPVKLSHAPIPPSLDPPGVTLTPRQQTLAGGMSSEFQAEKCEGSWGCPMGGAIFT